MAFGCALLAGAAVFLAVQHGAISRLQAENGSLREENGQLAWLGIENQRLSNLVSQANRSLSGEQLSELLKLRSEVGFLRKQTNELGRSQAENHQLRAEVAAKVAAASDPQSAHAYIPKEAWAFAGYDTPEAALQSVWWVVNKGDSQAFLTSITPDMLQKLGETGIATDNLAGALAEETRKIKGYQVMKATVLAEDHMVLDVAFDGDLRKVKLGRTQGQWKLAEPITH
jgi:hypothetical protein